MEALFMCMVLLHFSPLLPSMYRALLFMRVVPDLCIISAIYSPVQSIALVRCHVFESKLSGPSTCGFAFVNDSFWLTGLNTSIIFAWTKKGSLTLSKQSYGVTRWDVKQRLLASDISFQGWATNYTKIARNLEFSGVSLHIFFSVVDHRFLQSH